MTAAHLRQNVQWNVLSRLSMQIVAALSNLLLARYLGSAGFGEYAFISAVVLIGNAFTTFGTDMVLIRRIASEKDYSDLSTALVIQTLISFMFIILVFLFRSYFSVGLSLLIYSFALLPLSFFTVFTTALRGAQQMQAFSALHFITTILQLAAVLLLVREKWDVQQLAFLLLGVQVVATLIGSFLCAWRIENFFSHWSFSWKRVPMLLRASYRMAVIGTLRLVYEKLAVSLLPIISTTEATGLFSASLRVLDAAKLGHLSALTAIYPEMARDKKFVAHRTGFGLLLFSAACISLMLFLFSRQIIFLLFGGEFADSISSLKVLAWILVPYFVVSYYSLAFVVIDVEKPVLLSLVASLILMLILLVMLSPLYGVRGAALSLLSAEIFQALLLWLQWRFHAVSKLSE